MKNQSNKQITEYFSRAIKDNNNEDVDQVREPPVQPPKRTKSRPTRQTKSYASVNIVGASDDLILRTLSDSYDFLQQTSGKNLLDISNLVTPSESKIADYLASKNEVPCIAMQDFLELFDFFMFFSEYYDLDETYKEETIAAIGKLQSISSFRRVL
jgi:hypothetical protein